METQNITDSILISQENQTCSRPADASELFNLLIPYEKPVPMVICIFAFLVAFACLINIITLTSIGRSDDLTWQPRFFFCKCLVLSDLIQALTIGPSVISSLVQRRTVEPSLWCYLQYFIGTMSIYSSLLTIACMTVERYVFICHPMHYLLVFTQTRQRLVVLLVWLSSITVSVINMGLLLLEGEEKKNVPTMGLMCEPDTIEQHMGSPRTPVLFRKIVGSFTLLLCFAAHAFSYFRMYEVARKAMKPFKKTNVKARKTVMFYCGMLLMQLLPLLMKVTLDILLEFEEVGTAEGTLQSEAACKLKPLPSVTVSVLHVSMLILILVPPCINPVVYGLRNAEIWKVLTKVSRCRTGERVDHRGVVEVPMERIRNGNVLGQNQVLAG